MEQLTNEDIAVLMDALDALQRKEETEGMLVGILGAALLGDNEKEAHDFFKDSVKESKEKSRSIEETIILLKAKLIKMRDDDTVSSAMDFLRKRE